MAAMQQIADWLKKLGLSEYAQRFTDNDVDASVLPDLTDQDLKDLGVSLGHRRKMLRAIAELQSVEKTAPENPPARPFSALQHDAAERRQITVMFCDLVDSTGLSTRMDPEDLRQVISTYHKCVAETVARFDGFVAKYMGDGVVIYFGYPQAHEDDAERAVRSALAVVNVVSGIHEHQDAPLQARVGVATGVVVVGDLLVAGEAQERAVVGETPNLAARLQALADPGQVVIAATTRRLLGGQFEYRDLGSKMLKGLSDPIRAWQVLGAGPAEGRFEAQHETKLAPLVGREEEIELLLRRWRQAVRGQGRVVLITGEPGIGKSRLTAALQERIEESCTRLRYFCSPHHVNSAFFPISSQLERAAGFTRDDFPSTRLTKLEALAAESGLDTEEIAVLAELLSIPGGERLKIGSITAQERKDKTLAALLAQLERLAVQRPLLVVFEDVHWIDPTSLEFLTLAIEQAARMRLLLLVIARPEFIPPWPEYAHVTTLTLTRLSRHDAAAVVERITNSKELPHEVMSQILRRTDGVPLFVEELTKSVLESGLLREDANRYVLDGPLSPLAIPDTLHASLLARLDRLAPVREVAQIGAAVGREFSYELLGAISGLPFEKLQEALSQLVRSELLFPRGEPPHAVYTFKHALVRDAAYGSLLRNQRQQLHARIASILETLFVDLVASEPELVAHHYTEAGLAERATRYWEDAGVLAAKRSANKEAIAHFEKGLELLEHLPDRANHVDQELRLLLALGPVLMTTRTSAAPEIERVYIRARKLAQGSGKLGDLFPTVWGSWLVAFMAGEVSTANRLLDELFSLAHDQECQELILQAHHAAWPTLMTTGDLAGALQHINSGTAMYQREIHGQHAHLYGGHDPAVCAHALGALLHAAVGRPDEAIRRVEQAQTMARAMGHPPTLSQALWCAAELHYIRREPREIESYVAAVLPVLSEYGSAVNTANAIMLRGWALTVQGYTETGIADIREGMDAWRRTGSKYHVPYRLSRAADAYRMAGNVDEALRLIADAIAVSNRTEDRWFEADLYRIQGEALSLVRKKADDAESSFRRALATARRQGARVLELRAALGLGRLLGGRSQRLAARDLLYPIYIWFTEGLETSDLKDAKAMLDAFA
jgi:class 3 adenylate cyclase/tetratricopeptide (TPR) repeat protein